MRGIEVNDNTLSFDVIKEAVEGPGHFLGSDQTVAMMESEYLYPSIGDRRTPDVWYDNGAKTIWDIAREKVKMMMQHYPSYLSAEIDAQIRAEFDIKISAEEMSSTSRRW